MCLLHAWETGVCFPELIGGSDALTSLRGPCNQAFGRNLGVLSSLSGWTSSQTPSGLLSFCKLFLFGGFGGFGSCLLLPDIPVLLVGSACLLDFNNPKCYVFVSLFLCEGMDPCFIEIIYFANIARCSFPVQLDSALVCFHQEKVQLFAGGRILLAQANPITIFTLAFFPVQWIPTSLKTSDGLPSFETDSQSGPRTLFVQNMPFVATGL